jgi:hypothetical protein
MNWSGLKNSKVVATAMVAWILVAGVVIARQLTARTSTELPTKAYYTTDDTSPAGALAALFVDDNGKLVPFEHDGRPAYRAYVFTCDGGKTTFVSHLERYTPDGLRKMRQLLAKGGRGTPAAAAVEQDVILTGCEIKRPGDSAWVLNGNDQLAGPILNVRCPDGTRHGLDAVWPR